MANLYLVLAIGLILAHGLSAKKRAEKRLGFPLVYGRDYLKQHPEMKKRKKAMSVNMMRKSWLPDEKHFTNERSAMARKAQNRYRIEAMILGLLLLLGSFAVIAATS